MSESNNNQIICPNCNSSISWADANFCPYCGVELFNYCTNPECEMCTENPGYEEDWTLHKDYKFCPECGAKSTFYDFLSNFESDLPQNGQ